MTCLIEECVSQAKCRGVCQSHYLALGKMVKAGRATWYQLESFGMTRPSKKIKKGLAEQQFEKAMKRLKREE